MKRSASVMLVAMLVAVCGPVAQDLPSAPKATSDTTPVGAQPESSSSDTTREGSSTDTTDGASSTPTSGTDAKPAPPSTLPVTTAPVAAPAAPAVPEGLQPVVASAVADLAARLGVSQSDIVVVSAEEVTWRDGSVGCPQPGMAYTQALVNGTRIRLASGGMVYEYHSGGGQDPFYCATPEEPVSAGAGDS